MIQIEEINYGSYQEVRGSVDHREIISMDNNIQGKWGVSSSAILPWEASRAEEILKCYNQVFERVLQIKLEQTK